MVSTFYSSNQQKQKDYIKNRYIQEQNDDEQQNRVDRSIIKNLNLEEQATELSKLATRVVNRLGSELIPFNQGKLTSKQLTPMQYLTNSINNGQLTQLFEKIKKLPSSKLNKTQLLIRNDLNDTENKKMINFQIENALPNGADAIAKTVVESLGGIGNEDKVLDMIEKIYNNMDELKKEEYERVLMKKEDINVAKKRRGRPKKN